MSITLCNAEDGCTEGLRIRCIHATISPCRLTVVCCWNPFTLTLTVAVAPSRHVILNRLTHPTQPIRSFLRPCQSKRGNCPVFQASGLVTVGIVL